MKKLLCFLIAIFLLQFSFSQNTSNKLTLKDSLLYTQYIDSGIFFLYKSNDKVASKSYFERALTLSKKINYKDGVIKSYLYILNTDFDNYSFKDSILGELKPYTKNPKNKKDSSNLIIYNLNISDVFLYKEDYVQCTQIIDYAIDLSEKIKDTTMLMNCYKQYMVVNTKIKNNREVIKYGLKSLALTNEKSKNIDFNNGAAAQFVASSYLRLNILDSSIYFYEIAGEYFKKNSFYYEYNSILMLEVLNVKYKKNKKDSLANYVKKEKIKHIFSVIKPENANVYGQALIILANSFEILEQKAKAKEYALRSLSVFNKLGKKNNELAALNILVKLTEGEEKNEYFDTYFRLKEELYETQKAETILSLQEKYNLQESEAQLLKEQNKNLKTKTYIQLGLLLLLVTSVLFFILFRYRVNRKNKQIERLRKQALQLQMNPHFFFNTLNSINSFIIENDKDQARNYLTKFSKLMRLTLENSQHEFIEIEKEVAFLDNYLSLEQARKQNFDYKINVSSDTMKLKIPTLLFQPLLENSVIHGFNNLSHRGKLIITIKRNHKGITIEVSDNGIGFEQAKQVRLKNTKHEPMATKILQERISFYSKGLSQLYYSKGIEGFETKGTSVSFSLPISN